VTVGIAADAASETEGGFGPLKAVLRAISADVHRKVRFLRFIGNSLIRTSSQEAASVTPKIQDIISRLTALEECFYSHPSDVADQRRRSEVIE
jgi:hypothetical protein